MLQTVDHITNTDPDPQHITVSCGFSKFDIFIAYTHVCIYTPTVAIIGDRLS